MKLFITYHFRYFRHWFVILVRNVWQNTLSSCMKNRMCLQSIRTTKIARLSISCFVSTLDGKSVTDLSTLMLNLGSLSEKLERSMQSLTAYNWKQLSKRFWWSSHISRGFMCLSRLSPTSLNPDHLVSAIGEQHLSISCSMSPEISRPSEYGLLNLERSRWEKTHI